MNPPNLGGKGCGLLALFLFATIILLAQVIDLVYTFLRYGRLDSVVHLLAAFVVSILSLYLIGTTPPDR